MLHVIVPVKTLEHAKMRLAAVLNPLERRALVLAMLGDVLRGVCAAPSVAQVSVISRDHAVLHAAAQGRAATIMDQTQSLNDALAQAAWQLALAESDALLVLPADLPLVTPADIDVLQRALGTGPGVVLASSRDGGTNALLVRPPLALPFLYGPHSLARHAEAAEQHGMVVEIVHSPGLLLDVDHPDDVALLAATAGNTAAQQFARGLGLAQPACCTVGNR